MRNFFIYTCLLFATTLTTLAQNTEQKIWAKVINPSTNIQQNAFYSSRVIYLAPKNSEFLITNEAFYHYEIQLPNKQHAWIEKTKVNKTTSPNQSIATTLIPVAYSPQYSYQAKLPFLDPSDNENKQLQQINIDGFYKLELSGRNYFPRDPSDPRWNTIKNDPLYNKLPPDVLLGPIKQETSLKFSLDSQINEDTSIFFDIEKIPDFPEKWDVEVNIKDNQIAFGKIETQFNNGAYSTLKKSIDGVKLKHETPEKRIILSNGKQRSNPQKMTFTGNGSSKYKLKHNAILNNSVSVWVNNQKLQEGDNNDYRVNHYTGYITFKTPKSVLDVIEVVYQYTNPIEDFIPILNKKEFTGFQAVYNNKEKRIRDFKKNTLTEYLSPSETKTNGYEFTHNPIEFGSETIFLVPLINKRTNRTFLSIQQELESYLSVDITIEALKNDSSQTTSKNPFIKNEQSSFFTLTKHSDQYQGYSISTEKYVWMPPIKKNESPYLATQTELTKKESRWQLVFSSADTISIQALYPSQNIQVTPSENVLGLSTNIQLNPSYHFKVHKTQKTHYLPEKTLIKNKDYNIQYEQGIIELKTPLPYKHILSSHYSYFQTNQQTDYFVGKNANGPFELSQSDILEKTIEVFLDGKKMKAIQDYLLLNNSVIFNSAINFPSLLSVSYTYKLSEEKEIKQDKNQLLLGVSYFQETIHNNSDSLIVEYQEQKTVENNIVHTSFTPISNPDNISVLINDVAQSISQVDPFTGKITLENSLNGSAVINYEYKRSEPSLLSFYADTTALVYSIKKQLYPNLNIPVKYQGIKKIEINNIELDESNYSIEWGPTGTTFNITFIEPDQESNQTNVILPTIGDKINIFYDYTPNAAVSGTLKHQQLGINIEKQLSKHLHVKAEIASAHDNYSHKSSTTEQTLFGNNSDTLQLEHSNIKENSESVFIRESISSAWVQVEESNYFINYETGEIIFSSMVPDTHQINVIYTYFLSNTEAITDNNKKNYYAQKLQTSYLSDIFESEINFEKIDLDYNPLSPISKARGSTTLESDITWKISTHNQVEGSYTKSIQESKTQQDNLKDRITTKLKLGKKNLSSVTNLNIEQEKQKNNNPSEEIRFQKDNLKYSIDQTLNLGPDNFKTNLFSSFSESLNDFIDKNNLETTRSLANKISSDIQFQKIFLFGKTTLNPSLEYSFSNVSKQNKELSFTKKNNYKLNSSFHPKPFWQTNTNYEFKNTKTGSLSETTTLSTLQNYRIHTSIEPYTWLKTSFEYFHNENMNNLNNTFLLFQDHYQANLLSLKLNDALKQLFKIQNNYITKTLRYSNTSASVYKDIKKELDFSTLNTNHSQTFTLNTIEPLSEAIFKDLSITTQDNLYQNTKESSNFKNESRQTNIQNYGFNFSYYPPYKRLKKTNYYLDISNKNQDILTLNTKKDDILQTIITKKPERRIEQKFKLNNAYLKTPLSKSKASVSTEFSHLLDSKKTLTNYSYSNINNDNDPKETKDFNTTRSFDVNTTFFQYINFKKIGPLNYNNKYNNTLKESIQSTHLKLNMTNNSNNFDTRNFHKWNNNLELKPFNHFDLTQSYNTENHENTILTNDKEQKTFIDKLEFTSALTIPIYNSLNAISAGSFKQTKQWEGNAINTSKSSLQSALDLVKKGISSEIFSNALDQKSTAASLGLSATPFKNITISSTLGYTNINDTIYKLENQNLTTTPTSISEINKTLTTKWLPIKGLDISSIFSLKQSKNNTQNSSFNTGYTHSLSMSYLPLQKPNFKVNISLSRNDNWGTLINTNEQEKSQLINASTVQTQITKQRNYTINGNLSINIIYPFPNTPVLDNLTIIGEGYIKSSKDYYNSNYTYQLSGLQLIFQLNY